MAVPMERSHECLGVARIEASKLVGVEVDPSAGGDGFGFGDSRVFTEEEDDSISNYKFSKFAGTYFLIVQDAGC